MSRKDLETASGSKKLRTHTPRAQSPDQVSSPATKDQKSFGEIVRLIAGSRAKALQAVNTALIELYWEIGSIISRKIKTAEWGEGVVDRLIIRSGL